MYKYVMPIIVESNEPLDRQQLKVLLDNNLLGNTDGADFKISSGEIEELGYVKSPFVAVDIVIEIGNEVVVIERKNAPFGFALPGGFVDYGEAVEDAAKREAKEETGLDVYNLRLIHEYSEPSRDPRGHIITIAYLAEAKGYPKAGDDAKSVRLVPWEQATDMALVGDHSDIIQDAYITFKEA